MGKVNKLSDVNIKNISGQTGLYTNNATRNCVNKIISGMAEIERKEQEKKRKEQQEKELTKELAEIIRDMKEMEGIYSEEGVPEENGNFVA